MADFLSIVPLRVLSPVRSVHSRASPGTLAWRATRVALEVLRHRAVDLPYFDLEGKPTVRLAGGNSGVVRQVFWFGREGYEATEVRLWSALCARAGTIVEIGANVGYFAVHGALAAPTASYLAIEPHPESARQLKENCRLNSLDNVSVVEAAAVGPTDGPSITLLVPRGTREATPTGAFVEGAEAMSRIPVQSIQVEARDASQLAGGADLIKIDAEGAEYTIISALWNDIVRVRPTLLVEVRRGTVELRQTLDRMTTELNYRLFATAPNRLEQLSPGEIRDVILQEQYETRDVLALPEESALPSIVP